MTTPTTPYALWQHVPLSECKQIVRLHQRMIQQPDYAARVHISAAYWQRALADVTDERDQFQDHLDGTIEAHKADIRRYNEVVAQLAAVTAERDALRAQLAAMTGEL